jgi:hypothetical protein
VLPKSFAELMTTSSALAHDYGYATFNLSGDTGQSGALGEAVGHLGDTYGFQSQLVYFPGLKFAMAVATNIETERQSQPKDVLCYAYNAAAGLLLQKEFNCSYTHSSYYGSGCRCSQAE